MNKDPIFCTLIPTGAKIKNKSAVQDVVFYYTRIQAEEALRHKRPGSSLLRIDKENSSRIISSKGLVPLIVSYKFTTSIVHRILPIKTAVKIKRNSNNTIEVCCKMEPKQLYHILNVLEPFLKKLFSFIAAATKNQNWIERELQQRELERELSFRPFVIFPSRLDHILIIRKTEKRNSGNLSHKSISILISLESCTFMVISGEKPDNNSSDFNKILLNFLDIDESKSFLVKKALGYYLDEFQKEMEIAEEEEFYSTPSP